MDFNRRRNLWFGLTILAFLAHSFGVYVAVTSVVLTLVAQREQRKLALLFAFCS
jgi:hypothetical protein